MGLVAEQVKVAAVPVVVLTEEGAVVISENNGICPVLIRSLTANDSTMTG